MLSPDDFAGFFQEVHGCEPFPWQRRLVRRIADQGEWPRVLDLPTGSGKTAAIDIAVFHLALESKRAEARRAPVRIAFVVDRRLVVDDAFVRARKLERALVDPGGSVTARVASSLREFVSDDASRPLIARRLRGGIPREDDWARTPSQPTVLCSTVDQVGSRLLFRGYGVTDSMKPVQAGLIGADCLMLLDEAHLAEPFRQTLEWVRTYQGRSWRETEAASPWGASLLTATPGDTVEDAFSLDDEDRSHPVLARRLNVAKPAHLVSGGTKGSRRRQTSETTLDAGMDDKDFVLRTDAIVEEVRVAIEHFAGTQIPGIGVVVNRVSRARSVFERLGREFPPEAVDRLLLIGPARSVDREQLTDGLAPLRTDASRSLERPLVVVATQCIEVGVDIDLDALITEAAPLDALRQRFGRLNRAGRDVASYAAIVAAKSDLSARTDDPVYGKAIKVAWERMIEAADTTDGCPTVEFGLSGFNVRMDEDALARRDDAPILLPAHLDLLSQTAPVPAADPETALFLHGARRQPDSIAVIWRADVDPIVPDVDVRRLLVLVPPRSTEAITLPVWAAQRGLRRDDVSSGELADVATTLPTEVERGRSREGDRRVFRWRGNDERSRWIELAALRPGDTIVLPARYGRVDRFGWNPGSEECATDVEREAATPFAGRRFAVRIAPGLLDGLVADDALAEALAGAASERWQDLRAALLDLDLPDHLREDLSFLDEANRRASVRAHLDLYGQDEARPRGVVFVAPFGIKNRAQEEEGRPNSTEDDASGSVIGVSLPLRQHSEDVERKARCFAKAAGLAHEQVEDLELAGFLHDAGKVDVRFQAWLHHGDPLGSDPEETASILAKSDRVLPRSARIASGLPEHWRHEAFSVRLAPCAARFAEANDPDLVLWLVGTHHGHGRPFFPHRDASDDETRALPDVLGLPAELPPSPGPQSLAFDWHGLDWAGLFARLKARYGVWELARMEAILRLADHRASEERAREGGS